ncbi:MAG: LptF/LptG family permease [Gemmatimonadota bacterium]
MIRILDRLVARTFVKLFVIFLLASPPLFILGDITENLDTYVDRGLTAAEVARAYFFQLPLFIQWSFPIAALIATVFTVHGMTAHREIVAAKAGGISFHRTILPILVLGVLLTGAALVLSEVVPRGKRIAAQILRDEDPRRAWRSDFVYKSEGGLLWQVQRLTASDGRMRGVVVEDPGGPERPTMSMVADAAEFDSIQGWTFAQGFLRYLYPDSTGDTYEFQRMRMAGLSERPDELLEAPREPDEMTYRQIDRLARIVERTGGNASKLLVQREQKLSIPVATLVVILLGAPLATSSARGGAAYGIGISLGITILYLLLFKVAGAVGGAGAMSPALAAWLPNVLFLAAALFFLRRVRT